RGAPSGCAVSSSTQGQESHQRDNRHARRQESSDREGVAGHRGFALRSSAPDEEVFLGLMHWRRPAEIECVSARSSRESPTLGGRMGAYQRQTTWAIPPRVCCPLDTWLKTASARSGP